jgi:hypothetical protein
MDLDTPSQSVAVKENYGVKFVAMAITAVYSIFLLSCSLLCLPHCFMLLPSERPYSPDAWYSCS